MVGRPGRNQSTFTSGEIDLLLHERDELKYFGSGLAIAENIVVMPQGGFTLRGGLRDVGALHANAGRIVPFSASDGSAYDLVLRDGEAEAWGETAKLDTFAVAGVTLPMLPEMTYAQQLDTLLLFHRDLKSQRVIHAGATDWANDDVPFTAIPNHDYGEVYTNGVSARWRIEFVGLVAGNFFALTISGQESPSIAYDTDNATLRANIEAGLADVPGLNPGFVVAHVSGKRFNITFDGAGNEGDGWAVSGRVVNNAESAIISVKIRVGVLAGEPLISEERGWPQCGAFFGQRLLIGGFKSLPNAWAFSELGNYFNYDDRIVGATGAAVVPMNVPGGESLEHIVDARNLLLFTSGGEYWIRDEGLSKTEVPNHVRVTDGGARRGVPVVPNEGGSLYVQASGGVIGEARYTDVEGNFVSMDISVIAAHLIDDVVDLAGRKARISSNGNQLGVVLGDGQMRMATLLRQQEVVAFTRMASGDAQFHAVAVNGRNEMSVIASRATGKRLERLEDGLLLDEAVSFVFDPAQSTISGLTHLEGRSVWCLADGNVFGPYDVEDGEITLPITVSVATVGTWTPPRVQTLPLPRTIGPNMVLKRKARIHSVVLSLVNTTSIAISANGGRMRDIDLVRWGATADVPELEQAFTGTIKVRGLTGYSDEPFITISQLRPGRMTVRSVTLEAQL